jgi:glycosyltransferase involved in cell wall biosynthesis
VARLGGQWTGGIVFVGEPLREEQKKLVADLGLGKRVRELGALSDASLASVYAGAHALMFPSFCEGFGWPILEAQACDCPVITADNTSLTEVAGEGALVFEAGDVDGMSQAIMRLGTPSVREKCIKSGRNNVGRFTLSGMLDAYETLYWEALADAR